MQNRGAFTPLPHNSTHFSHSSFISASPQPIAIISRINQRRKPVYPHVSTRYSQKSQKKQQKTSVRPSLVHGLARLVFLLVPLLSSTTERTKEKRVNDKDLVYSMSFLFVCFPSWPSQEACLFWCAVFGASFCEPMNIFPGRWD